MEFTDADLFEAISSDPEEFIDMVLRVDLMLTLGDHFRERDISPVEIGELLGIAQSWVNELMELNVDLFSSQELRGFCAKVGIPSDSLLDQVRAS